MKARARKQQSWRLRLGRVLALAAVGVSLWGPAALALPSGGQIITQGAGTIGAAQNGVQTITQTADKMIINWKDFSIRNGETVQFNQKNAAAVALNRVTGGRASEIYGALKANGKIFLVNPKGILFGGGAEVNVGGIVASTLDITDTDFKNGTYKFSAKSGERPGEVIQQGKITVADGGYAALLGSLARNDGTIAVVTGGNANAVLAAGETITLQLGNNSLGVTVDKAFTDAQIANKRAIDLGNGALYLTAGAMNDLMNRVTCSGAVRAGKIVLQGGRVSLQTADLDQDGRKRQLLTTPEGAMPEVKIQSMAEAAHVGVVDVKHQPTAIQADGIDNKGIDW